MAWATDPWVFALFTGVIIGTAQAGTTYAVIYGVIGRNVPAERRSWAMGVAAAAGSFGQFLMVPVEGLLISQMGWQTALVMLAARVTSEQRLSKNNLKRNFISYKAQQGWVDTFPEADKEAAKEGKRWMKDAKGVISDRLAERLLAAQTLSQYDYIRIRDRMEKLNLPVCEEVMDCYRRTNIELFYCRQIDLDLIRLDSGGNYRAKVNRFRHMTDEVSLREGKLKIDVNQNGKEQGVYLRSIKDFKISTLLLNTILRQTTVFDGSAFNPDKEYTSADLS
jgi:hypothetical protein